MAAFFRNADRPLCALCPPEDYKRAVFFDTRRAARPLCAFHAVIEERASWLERDDMAREARVLTP
jgi:hypothetical protein